MNKNDKPASKRTKHACGTMNRSLGKNPSHPGKLVGKRDQKEGSIGGQNPEERQQKETSIEDESSFSVFKFNRVRSVMGTCVVREGEASGFHDAGQQTLDFGGQQTSSCLREVENIWSQNSSNQVFSHDCNSEKEQWSLDLEISEKGPVEQGEIVGLNVMSSQSESESHLEERCTHINKTIKEKIILQDVSESVILQQTSSEVLRPEYLELETSKVQEQTKRISVVLQPLKRSNEFPAPDVQEINIFEQENLLTSCKSGHADFKKCKKQAENATGIQAKDLITRSQNEGNAIEQVLSTTKKVKKYVKLSSDPGKSSAIEKENVVSCSSKSIASYSEEEKNFLNKMKMTEMYGTKSKEDSKRSGTTKGGMLTLLLCNR